MIPIETRENTFTITATQRELKTPQRATLVSVLDDYWDLGFRWQRNGDCIGGDTAGYNIWKAQGGWVHGHPPINPSKRAWLKFDAIEEPDDYIPRNHAMVDVSSLCIACPNSMTEQLAFSGTWATLRYAKKIGIPWTIVYPDGTLEGRF